MTLDQIGVREGTDKSSLLHNYLEKYEKVLPSRASVRSVLEIGLKRGRSLWKHNKSNYPSLMVWREWFNRATIYGIDLKSLPSKHSRIITYVGDQSKEASLLEIMGKIGGQFDVIIDDGSHRADDQELTFVTLTPYLRPGGVYIVEDLNCTRDFPEEKLFRDLIARPINRSKRLALTSAEYQRSIIFGKAGKGPMTVVFTKR